MKSNGKKFSVKVDVKDIITENHKEFVRIKRKVIQRISRKVASRQDQMEVKPKISVIDVFKRVLKVVSWRNNSKAVDVSDLVKPAKSEIEAEEVSEEIKVQDSEDPEVQGEGKAIEEFEDDSKDLYMPLQF